MIVVHNGSLARERPKQETRDDGPTVSVLACWCFGEETDPTRSVHEKGEFCLQLFRRAIMTRDEEAWTCIYHHYEPVVRAWVSEHQTSRMLDQEYYASVVNGTFANLILALTPAKMERFNRFSVVLHYLKRCAHRAAQEEVDEHRARQREEMLDTLTCETPDPADAILSQVCAQGVWKMIWNELPEDQWILLALTCECGLKPSEIASRYRERFTSVEKVYRIKHAALHRIRHSRRMQRYLKALRNA